MRNRGIRQLAGLAAASALALGLSGAGAALAAPDGPRAARSAEGVDMSRVIVQLSGDPIATSTAVERSGNDKVLFNAAKTRNVRADLVRERNAFRQWLKRNAPEARITGQFDVALNGVAVELNGTPISVIQRAPGVTAVGYENVYTPMDMEDPDLTLIDAFLGWDAAGAGYEEDSADPSEWAGHGVKVGVIDSGIDITHPCFDGEGYPDAGVEDFGEEDLVNDKVVVAKVFNNKLNQSRFTAKAVEAHGTHVAGTIACELDTPAVVHGVTIPYAVSGVAPGAQLGNYNVFPGTVESARSEDILNALDAAAEDGMDVINMSLGGPANGNRDLLTNAVDNLDRGGIVVAVSAGNEGPGYYTVGSPGSAERALTAGASSVGHTVALDITDGESSWEAAIGDFRVPAEDLTAELAVATMDRAGEVLLGTACSDDADLSEQLADAEGKIALIGRGGCTFSEKVANADDAGAMAVIVANNIAGDGPIAMAASGPIPDIPPVGVSQEAGPDLRELDGEAVTMEAPTYRGDLVDSALMDFSSAGPTDVSYRVKPDVVAPGGNVLSAIPGGWAFYDGTSMAAPHLAGMAAVILGAEGSADWEPWQVRSAIVNTAVRDGVVTADGPVNDVQKVGSGLADLGAAVEATVALSSPSVSFGAIPSGSGRLLTRELTITNLTDEVVSLLVGVEDSSGVGDFDVSVARPLALEPAESAQIRVNFQAPKGSPVGGTQAFLVVKAGEDELAHAALYAYIK